MTDAEIEDAMDRITTIRKERQDAFNDGAMVGIFLTCLIAFLSWAVIHYLL